MSLLANNRMFTNGKYSIANSIRSRSSGSTYLSRTPSVAGNRQKFTISAWVKRSAIAGVQQGIISARVDDSNRSTVYWTGSETFNIANLIGGTNYTGLGTAAIFRDVSAWYHLLVAVDTTDATSTNRVKMYVNGVQASISGTYPTMNETFNFNNASQHTWGMNNKATPDYSDQYMSDCYIIDGSQLTPTSFGKFDNNGVWVPIKYTYTSVPLYGSFYTSTVSSPLGISTTNILDGNSSTQATHNGASYAGQTVNQRAVIMWDLGSAQRIGKFKLTNASASGTSSAPYTLWYSPDNTTWTSVDGYNVVPTAQDFTTYCDITARYWAFTPSSGNWAGTTEYLGGTELYPITSTNGYGANGCHLEFKNASALGTDTSGTTTTYNSVIPLMTSNTAPSGTVTCNSEYNGPAWKAFDSDGTTWWASNSSTTGWIAYQFTSNQVVSSYGITNSNLLNQSPTAWTFDGWNGSAWITLDTRSSISWASLYQTQIFTFTNTTGYIQYRLNITNGSGGGAVTVGTLTMYSLGANDFVSNGFASTDQMVDTPTNNYCTLNPLIPSDIVRATLSSGNLRATYGGGAAYGSALGTIPITSGKWYWEVFVVVGNSDTDIGVVQYPGNMSTYTVGQKQYIYRANGNKRSDSGGVVAYGSTYTTGDIVSIAFDSDNGVITFYKNNVSQGVAFSGISPSEFPMFPCLSVNTGGNYLINFGQSTFAYTPPTGFKALCTANLPSVAITKPKNYHNEVLWSGSGVGARAITGLGFSPDFVWLKNRSFGYYHQVMDTVRGTAAGCLYTNATNAEDTAFPLTSFDSDGFTLGNTASLSGQSYGSQNQSGYNYVGWSWKKGSTPGFDIVTYTGNGNAQTINHSLGAVPAMIIVKSRSAAIHWAVYHKNMNASPAGYAMYLEMTIGAQSDATNWNNTAPTSSVFSVGQAGASSSNTSYNGATYVAYLWAEVPGFSKFGSYTGNGNADGPFVYCGFKPRFIMIKNTTDATYHWRLIDTARNTSNVSGNTLYADLSNAEDTPASSSQDILSNGFKVRSASDNISGSNYIYAAFAENPFGGSNVSPATAR